MADRFYIGIAGLSGTWNSTTCWSSGSGGLSGYSVPGASDVAIFDNNSPSCLSTAPIASLGTLNTRGDFSNTIFFDGYSASVNNVLQLAGTINCGTSAFTINTSHSLFGGTFYARDVSALRHVGSGVAATVISGGTFDMPATEYNLDPTTAAITVFHSYYGGAVLNHNNGTFRINKTTSLEFRTTTPTLYNLKFGGTTPTPNNPIVYLRGRQEWSVVCPAGAGISNGQYFTFSSPTVNYYIYFTTAAGTNDPAIGGKTAIEVVYTVADSAGTTAIRVANALLRYGSDAVFSGYVSTATVYITNKAEGLCTAVANGDLTGFTFAVTVPGANPIIVENEFRIQDYAQCYYGLIQLKGTCVLNKLSASAETYAGAILEFSGTGDQTLKSETVAVADFNRMRVNKASGTITFSPTGGLAVLKLRGSSGSPSTTSGSTAPNGRNYGPVFEHVQGTCVWTGVQIRFGAFYPYLKTNGTTDCKFEGGMYTADNPTTTPYLGSNVYISGKLVLSSRLFGLYTIYCSGDIDAINGTDGSYPSDAGLEVNGTGDQTITGIIQTHIFNFAGIMPNLIINKPSGTLYLIGAIYCMPNNVPVTQYAFRHIQGTVNYGTSTVVIGGYASLVDFNGTEPYNVGVRMSNSTQTGPLGTVTINNNVDIISAGQVTGVVTIKGRILTGRYNAAAVTPATFTFTGASESKIYSLRQFSTSDVRLTLTGTGYTVGEPVIQAVSNAGGIVIAKAATYLTVRRTTAADFVISQNVVGSWSAASQAPTVVASESTSGPFMMLCEYTLTVTNGNLYTVGETVIQASSSAMGVVLSKTATTIVVRRYIATNFIVGTYNVVGHDSGASQLTTRVVSNGASDPDNAGTDYHLIVSDSAGYVANERVTQAATGATGVVVTYWTGVLTVRKTSVANFAAGSAVVGTYLGTSRTPTEVYARVTGASNVGETFTSAGGWTGIFKGIWTYDNRPIWETISGTLAVNDIITGQVTGQTAVISSIPTAFNFTNGNFTINKNAGVAVTLKGELLVNAASQTTTVTQGKLDLDGHNISATTLAVNDTLVVKGTETITATTKTLNQATSTVETKTPSISANIYSQFSGFTNGASFANLKLAGGKTHQVTAGQAITIKTSLTGDSTSLPSNPVKLVSSSPGSLWNINIDSSARNNLGNRAEVTDCAPTGKQFYIPGSKKNTGNSSSVVNAGHGSFFGF